MFVLSPYFSRPISHASVASTDLTRDVISAQFFYDASFAHPHHTIFVILTAVKALITA
jgi:hypothetical protein